MSLQEFAIIKKLGAGAFGKVYKVKRKTDNKIYALKSVYLPKLKEKGFSIMIFCNFIR